MKWKKMKRMNHALWSALMLFIAISSIKADGGDVLQRTVSLPKMKGTVYSLLSNVSQQSGYMFIYDSTVVDNDAVVKVKGGKRSIREAVCEITGNANLEFKVIGTHILISAALEKKEQTQDASHQLSETITISGTLLDKETSLPVASATVGVKGTSWASITNQDGDFKLSLPYSLREASVVFSHLGYVSQELELLVLMDRHHVFSLEPQVIPLQEIVIRRVDPKKLLRQMMEQRSRNYSHDPVYLTTFYREGVQLNTKFQNLTEAVFKVYKADSYSFVSDQVKLLKMKRLNNVEAQDSMLVKIKSGIQACFQLDLMKDITPFMTPDTDSNFYIYTSEEVTFLDNRFVNVVHFEQRKEVSEPLFCGELYIDSETSALLQARIELQPKYVKNAASMFVERHTRDVRMIPQKVEYTVSYKPWQGTYYIHHVRGDLHFKVKRRPAFFSSRQLHIWFEMITCKVDTEQVTPFPRTERLPTRTIFADTYFKYDANFWKDFNIILLEEEISKLIEKISLKVEEIGD